MTDATMVPFRSMRWPRLVRLIAYRGSINRADRYECSMERHHVSAVAQHSWWVIALWLAYVRAWQNRSWFPKSQTTCYDFSMAERQSDNQSNPPPTTLIGTAGVVADKVTGGLATQPMLLVMVVLNGVFCGAASWYLVNQESNRHKERLLLMERCFGTSSIYSAPQRPSAPRPPEP